MIYTSNYIEFIIQVFCVPMDAVYSAPYELYFKPRDPKYNESKTVFHWKEPKKGGGKVIKCEPNKPNLEPIYFRVRFFSKVY